MPDYPRSVPLHSFANSHLHSIDCRDLDAVYQNAKRQMLETFNQLIDDPQTENIQQHMETLLESYHQLYNAEQESKSLSEALRIVKNSYVEETEKYDPVSLDNWDSYKNNTLENPPTLLDMFETMEPPGAPTQLSHDDKILKSLPFIWKDPTCVIPDQSTSNVEDDIQIEGGVIELVCPITCKPFENPMISAKCNHVFDKEGLVIYFNDSSSRDCPQGGCSQKLTLRDFVPDTFMKLRCKIAKLQQNSNLVTSNQQAELDII